MKGANTAPILKAMQLTNPHVRPVLTIDCADLDKASSDSALLTSLAKQTGYWPVFPFINSLSNLIDIASVGVIGQKGILHVRREIQDLQLTIIFESHSGSKHLT